ncbi:MAG: PaaI family thioesterase [Spirochaetia bacterium]|jgi:acyl-coenzyme A thioesterase PaaI-like protein|nr:PaaI family thioesterase [Spirochaetia bacterium]
MTEVAGNPNCFICGQNNPSGLHLKFSCDSSGKAISEFIIPEHLIGYDGIFHGGLITAVLDDTMFYAVMQDNPDIMTVNINISFKSPAYTGTFVRAEGEVTGQQGRVISAIGRLFDKETLLSEAEGKFVIVSPEKTKPR